VADVTAIRQALAAQIAAGTGLRAEAEPRDQVTPPVALILPGNPFLTYGQTMDEALGMGLIVLFLISDAPPVDQTQRAMDSYLSIGTGEIESIAAAILKDPTLGGHVHWCEPVSVTNYNRVDYAGQQYFGSRLNVTVGAI
jgi:hypothetical protein